MDGLALLGLLLIAYAAAVIFITSYSNGKLPKEIFEAHGFRMEVLGIKRIQAAQSRWAKAYQIDGIIYRQLKTLLLVKYSLTTYPLAWRCPWSPIP